MPVNCTANMTLGTLCVSVEARKSASLRMLQQQYGDGYVARRASGVNTLMEMWSVTTPPLPFEQIEALENEIIALANNSFEWTPPNETATTPVKRWILDPPSWDWSYSSDDLASLSFTLRRFYR